MLISVVVREDEGRFLAHALDFDLVAAGESVQQALDSLREVVATYFAACVEMGITSVDEMRREAPEEYRREAEQMLSDTSVAVFVGRWDVSDLLPGPREEAVVAG